MTFTPMMSVYVDQYDRNAAGLGFGPGMTLLT